MQPEATPLLQTKLDVPRPCAHTLARERLLALLPGAPGTRLVLLCAPAGFGKTTLLAAWCGQLAAQPATTVAWLALEERDNDPARFLAYLATALGQALPAGEAGETAPADLSAAGGEGMLTRLVNRLAALERDVLLVLDDYHLIRAPAVHAAVAFLLEHLPSRARLAIGSRSDPPLPLARLRARQQLIDLRAADLRFTPEEVQAFLAARDLALTPDEAHAIGAYVEGWPAGVQLVALALCAAPYEAIAGEQPEPCDTPASPVLARLHGSQQHLFAYLADDVFERQPAHRKAFLIQTAILDRMCGPLCDAVLGVGEWELDGKDATLAPSPNSHAPTSDSYSRLVLEQLERDNLFVMPLDGERRWYRYHHLFRAFLCARLEREPALAVAELHRRASAWYEQHQLPGHAIDHALAAGAPARAAVLIESSAAAIIARGEYATLHRWLDQLPGQIVAEQPGLCVWAAWAALLAGEVARIEPALARAERAWQAAPDQRRLGEAAHLRAHLARLRSDPAQTIAAAWQALACLPEDAPTLRAGSLLALGAGQLLAGDLAAAGPTLQEAYLQCQAHNFLGMFVALRCLGDLAAQRGQLQIAAANYQEVIALVGARALWEGWQAAIGLGELARERNDLDRALGLLQPALAAAEQAGVAVYLPAGYIALARTLQARGDSVAAALALGRALAAARLLGSPAYARLVRAEQARLALAQGDQESAGRWQLEVAAELANPAGAERTAEACIQARVLIAQARQAPAGPALHAAHSLLTRLREEATAHQRSGSLIEILALSALEAATAGRRDQACRLLVQALQLAMPAGYTRVFLDEGAPMRSLLAECRLQLARPGDSFKREHARPLLAYTERLLAAFPGSDGQVTGIAALEAGDATYAEPLSARELEVLRLLAGGASNQAIAAALVISIGTVKSHINHILGKLAACNRTEAVSRAQALGLLAR